MAARRKKSKSVWNKADKDRLIGYAEKWKGLLLMNGWHINITFSETAMPDTDNPDNVDDSASASCAANGPYMSGHSVTIYPRMLREPDRSEQERRIVHELVHIITEPSKELTRRMFHDKFVTWVETRDTNERMTDWIANIVTSLYDLQHGL